MFTSEISGFPYADVFALSKSAIAAAPFDPVSNVRAIKSSTDKLSSINFANVLSINSSTFSSNFPKTLACLL